jgi:hypothetical protein
VSARQNGVHLAVPAWMLDPVLCGRLRYEAQPCLSVSALIELRELLDGQPLLASSSRNDHQRRIP